MYNSVHLYATEVTPGEVRLFVYAKAEGCPRVYLEWTHSFERARLDEELDGLERCVRRRVTKTREAAALEGHARLIFDLLFPLGLKRLLRSNRGNLTIHATSLDVPWSILHDGSSFLGLRWAMGCLQMAGSGVGQTKKSRAGLLVIADPAGDLPAARYEGEALVRANAALGSESGCDVRLGKLRKNDFLRILGRYDLIHFAGHGDESSESNEGGWRFSDGHLGPAEIATVRGGSAPRMVFANAVGSR